MALMDEYNAADTDFGNVCIAAMAKRAGVLLINTPSTDPKYKMYVRTARAIYNGDGEQAKFVCRAFASFGWTYQGVLADETGFQTTVDNNFDIIAKLYDPTIDETEATT